ncbi:transcriptional regulator family: Fungal Specific TF [Penicillium roqueforti]|uniref:transcriptional regulator family: Fungal Specific TF n=1 Tax=Penicillium roqueforti TaxID=5082 RepID=UPI00190E44E5|nr:transcriptional regulator family: Fungal Specific TF [Penicillium roqueforti]KAF9247479.1 transcriptional regulator family: Fungal Specific TF [Penicillium roqueforti]KAI1834819.1 transcriptional regulator family: Fungal Specific TF [Penicillium roqueforti]KAI2676662.1 transcriptional regulator family: Fungal Specific TF [Penicillium roqueforti]KAI2683537.1 transcriptional regulator family: Fungal Specific TF [Penicillium roqueforti]KAI2709864.1 transcriptional regulator family: Fungal Spec
MASEFVPETSEIGSLTAHSNEDSQFVGSSSGVYFIKTVKRAFNGLDGPGSPESNLPTAEETLVGAEGSPRDKRQRTSYVRDTASSLRVIESSPKWTYDRSLTASLGNLPPPDVARGLMMMYFKVWHPLFPFLHGPTFLQAMENVYSNGNQAQHTQEPCADHRTPDLDLQSESKIQSPASFNSLLGTLSSRHDIVSLQALLAIQVYLVATMSLRPASTVGGCILRSMLHAGLHRCPFRYKQLSTHDRQLRKRVFWCAYAIDRYLSQALGLPLGIQDSDIDVCLPAARELHSPRGHSANGSSAPQHGNKEDYSKESVLASYVDSGTLTGRALELFHKSILVRSVRRSSVLFLVTDVHKWWNCLPTNLQIKPVVSEQVVRSVLPDSAFDFAPFFTVLYQHLILIIHRPSLSLDPSTAEFCSGLQTCIGAARAILSGLRLQVDSHQALFWPGFLSAAWMSGLVLALACQLNQYVLTKGLQEIDEFSGFLRLMSTQWETAKHCHMSLSVLAAKIQQSESGSDKTAKSQAYVMRGSEGSPTHVEYSTAREENRQRLGRLSHLHEEPGLFAGASELESRNNTWVESMHRGHDPTVVPSTSMYPSQMNEQGILTDTSSSTQMDLQDTDPAQLKGSSNFDLNMVDLIEGANFDTLFDMIGQQFPSF